MRIDDPKYQTNPVIAPRLMIPAYSKASAGELQVYGMPNRCKQCGSVWTLMIDGTVYCRQCGEAIAIYTPEE
jgi:hypothetical protein